MDYEIIKGCKTDGTYNPSASGVGCATGLACPGVGCITGLLCFDPDFFCSDGEDPEPKPDSYCNPDLGCRYSCGGANNNCAVEQSI